MNCNSAEPVNEQKLKMHLTPKQLAERWSVTTQTLYSWRKAGTGPKFLKLGKGVGSGGCKQKILYPLSEIEIYEQERLLEAQLT